MTERIREILEENRIAASAPCRIDLGGTLDISSLFYLLAHLGPCTFNIAVNLRTRVSLGPFEPGWVRVFSSGFDPAQYPLDRMPFAGHPLGLVFAVAGYFRVDGIEIRIESASPPRSALGGSSSAAVALVAAYSRLLQEAGEPAPGFDEIPVLAHALEESIAGVPCGMQDQLAAAFGGVNAWHWKVSRGRPGYDRQQVLAPGRAEALDRHILLAYCGVPHESRDINSTWIRQFLEADRRPYWAEIAEVTKRFIQCVARADFRGAARAMNRETEIRRELTPDVVDEAGAALVDAALRRNCGARFTGAGGGGCLWAIGPAEDIAGLRVEWADILKSRPDGALLDARVDSRGVEGDCHQALLQ